MKKLSSYTHAKHCTDMADCISGIEEINRAVKNRKNNKQTIPYYYYSRRSKLHMKLEKLRAKANIKSTVFEYNGHTFEAVRQFDLLEIDKYTPQKAKIVDIDNWDHTDFDAMADIIQHEEVNLAYADIFLMDDKYLVAVCYEHLYFCIEEQSKENL